MRMKKMKRLIMIKNKESHSYIYDYTRTAIGAFQGSLSSIKATDLGACVIKAVSYTHLTLPTKRIV